MNYLKLFNWRGAACIAAIGILPMVVGCGPGGASSHSESDNKNVITLTSANFQSEVLASSQPVLVDFWATWCGPCKMIAPVVSELATEFEGKAKVGKVDVDAQPDLAKQYKISAIPALLIFKDGKQVEQFVGVRSKKELKAKLDALVAAQPAKAAGP